MKKLSTIGLILIVCFSLTIPAAASVQQELPVNDQKIVNVAHRGASAYAPEHTMASYQMGVEQHADYIELDLQMTKDGVLIAMHDTTVDRTTNGSGAVKDFTLEEIKDLDAGSWFNEKYPERAKDEYVGIKVPTLEEVFQEYGRSVNYYIETKSPDVYPGMEAELVRLIEKYNLDGTNGRSSKVLIQSFSQDSLLITHELDPNLPLIQLISSPELGDGADEQLQEFKEYAVGIGPNFRNITEEYVGKVRDAGLQIHPYTVNTTEDMLMLLNWGVTGAFTNYPDVFNEAIKQFKSKR